MFTKSVLIQVWLFSLAIIDASNNTTQNTFDLKLLIAESAAFSICNVKKLTQECKKEHVPKIAKAMSKCEDQYQILQNCLDECYQDANNLFLQFDDPNQAINAISTAQQHCISQDNKKGCLYTKIEPFTKCIMEKKDKRRLLETQQFQFDVDLNQNSMLKRRLGSSEDFVETRGESIQRYADNAGTALVGVVGGVVGGAVGAVIGFALPFIFDIVSALGGIYCCSFGLADPQCTCLNSGPSSSQWFSQTGAGHVVSHIGMYVGGAIGAVYGIVKGVYLVQDWKESTVRLARQEFVKEAKKSGGFRSLMCLFRHPYCNIGRKGWFYFDGMANECCVGGYRTENGIIKDYHYCNCYGYGDKSNCKLCRPKTLPPTMNPTL